MKKITLLILLAVFALNGLFAQKSKFGHVDSNGIFTVIPGKEDATKAVEEYARTLESQLMSLYEEYENKMKVYEAEKDTYSASIKQLKEEDIMGLQQRIQTFQQRAQQDLQNKEAEVLEPLYNKIKDAVKLVGEEKGLTYVFDTSTLLYYSTESVDVTPDVKIKLGIK